MMKTYFINIQDYLSNAKNETSFINYHHQILSKNSALTVSNAISKFIQISTQYYQRVNDEHYLTVPDNSNRTVLNYTMHFISISAYS